MKTKSLRFLATAVAVGLIVFNTKAVQVITLGVSDPIGSTLIAYTGTDPDVKVIIPVGYTSPEFSVSNLNVVLTAIPTVIKSLTIQGDGSNPLLLVKGFDLPLTTLTSFSLKNLSLKGVDDTGSSLSLTSYLLAPTGLVVPAVTIDGCSIANYRGVFRLKSGTNITNLTVNNCVVRNVGNYNFITAESGSTLTNITCTNSTIYGSNGAVFGLSSTTPSTLNIANCTFDNLGYTSAKYFVDLGATNITTATSVTNCIFGKTVNSGFKGIRGGTGYTYTSTNNFLTSDWIVAGNDIAGATLYSKTASLLFKTPTTFDGATATATIGNYTIIDSDFPGKSNSGDPRWYYGTSSLTSNVAEVAFRKLKDAIVIKDPSDVTIITTSGQTVKQYSNVQTISTKELKKGIYMIKVSTGGVVKVEKVILN